MQTTAIYEKIIRSPEKLTWTQILKGAPGKHTRRDVDYAMIAGTTLDTVQTESGMLQKWQYPWLYRSVLKAGALGLLLVLAAIGAMIMVEGACENACLNLLLIVFGPCLIPVTLLVFFWEMNTPRNISLAQLIGYFFTGGVLSILISLILFDVLKCYDLAPCAEEPGKLLISMMFLSRLRKKHGRVYGLNGLAIGAAVGAGFAAFESAQYAYDVYGAALVYYTRAAALPELIAHGSFPFDGAILLPVLENVLLRNVCALSSHVLYCCPYACLVGLYMEKTGDPLSALHHPDFWISFALSFLVHMLWNMEILPIQLAIPVATVIMWLSARCSMRKSFASMAACVSGSGSGALTPLRIRGTRGVHTGVAFALTRPEILIGSSDCCQLVYPVATPGIDGQHAKLLIQNGSVYLTDVGSIAGTYVNGARLRQGSSCLLQAGDEFSLGGFEQCFRVT